MIRKIIPGLLLFSCAAFFAKGQNTCPTCETTLPQDIPADTLFLSPAPSGRAGEWYDADISFRVPKTTTPVAAVDSTVLPGVNINKITITGITNLPPGLNWHLPQAVFNLPDSTDGCIKICGMPLQPGLYFVNVVITAQVFVISQSATFTFPILIEPAQSITEGFTMNNASGCGEVTVSFTNNVPSGGNPGFSYFWDFGNGNFSPQENPVQQTYNAPGQHTVNYRAIVDTVGHILTRVVVNQVRCTDLFNGPDLKIFIYDPDDVEVFSSHVVQNATPPVEYIVNLPLGPGNYRLRVLDIDDGIFGGSDDECGSITFNTGLSGNLIGGPLHAHIEIINPVDTILSSDTVTVFSMPDAPLVEGLPDGTLCEGEVLTVTTNYTDELQWYRDSIPVLPGVDPILDITENGIYQVVYTSPDGCRVSSAPAVVAFVAPPAIPVFVSAQNRLSLFDAGQLPLAALIRWYQNDELIAGESGTELCITESGTYALEVTDLVTGCSSAFSLPITYNPAFPNCGASSTAEGLFKDGQLNVYPNPSRDDVELYLNLESPTEVSWQLIDANGRVLASGNWGLVSGEMRRRINTAQLPAGLYGLRLRSGTAFAIVKIVKI